MYYLYFIHEETSICALVKAKSEEEAWWIFAKNQMGNEMVKDFIDSFHDEGLFGDFYRDDIGAFLDLYTGELSERINKMSESYRRLYVSNHIKNNTREFWMYMPQHAEAYIREVEKGWHIEEYQPSFSEEFIWPR